MQIREKGRKILCIRTEYVPEKKRTYGRTVARQESYLSTVSEEVRELLTDEEAQELADWLDRRAESRAADTREISLSCVAWWMTQAVDAMDDDSARAGLSDAAAGEIWQAHERLSKALRRHGFKKPAGTAKKPRKADGQPGLDLDDSSS